MTVSPTRVLPTKTSGIFIWVLSSVADPDPNPDQLIHMFLDSRIRIHLSEVWIRIRNEIIDMDPAGRYFSGSGSRSPRNLWIRIQFYTGKWWKYETDAWIFLTGICICTTFLLLTVLGIPIRRIRMFLGFMEPDPFVSGTFPDKTPNPSCFVTSLLSSSISNTQ